MKSKNFEVGGYLFEAVRFQNPIPHWRLKLPNGKILDPGTSGISGESVPKMKASLEYLLSQVGAESFATGFDLNPHKTPVPSMYLVLKAKRDINGDRFPVRMGEKRRIRYRYESYDSPEPKVVTQALAGQDIEWGGAIVTSDFYEVVYHGEDHTKAV